MQRRDVLDRLAGEDRALLAAVWDKADRASRVGSTEFTYFLDPGQRTLIEGYRHLWPVELHSFGGYDQAERRIIAITHETEGRVFCLTSGTKDPSLCLNPWPLAAVEVQGSFQFAQVTHRDYLGSLLSLGLKRELFGDILVLPGGCQAVLHEHALPFVLSNWVAVGKVGISVRQIELSDLQPPERQQVVRKATVSTLRLDAVVAVAYGLSRSKAVALIKGGRVKLNHRPEERPDKAVDAGAMLSVMGMGRAQLLSVGGTSKSGRVFIEVGRWT
ncbi:MAG: RNA-binding protein [Bacillota bacterium]|jgi:RNA-binding protein YlmH